MVDTRATLRDGIAVGLIGYAAVAIFYSAFDLFAARGTFYTVDILGKAVFRGLRDPGVLLFPLQLDAQAIFWYNALHLVTSVAIGVIVTTLVSVAERQPSLRLAAFGAIAAGFVITIVVVGTLTEPLRPLLPWWSIVIANAVATLVAGSYLIKRRPGLSRSLGLVAG